MEKALKANKLSQGNKDIQVLPTTTSLPVNASAVCGWTGTLKVTRSRQGRDDPGWEAPCIDFDTFFSWTGLDLSFEVISVTLWHDSFLPSIYSSNNFEHLLDAKCRPGLEEGKKGIGKILPPGVGAGGGSLVGTHITMWYLQWQRQTWEMGKNPLTGPSSSGARELRRGTSLHRSPGLSAIFRRAFSFHSFWDLGHDICSRHYTILPGFWGPRRPPADIR